MMLIEKYLRFSDLSTAMPFFPRLVPVAGGLRPGDEPTVFQQALLVFFYLDDSVVSLPPDFPEGFF